MKLASHERRQFGIHGEGLDRHGLFARFDAGDHNIGERDRRERQQSGADAAFHLHLAPEDAACFTFEIGAVAGPVDEVGQHQRRSQHQYDQPSYGDE